MLSAMIVGRPRSQHFQRETQMVFEVGGVGDDDQCIGQALARLFAQHDVARHLLVRAGGMRL
jgi:hypothetical protein